MISPDGCCLWAYGQGEGCFFVERERGHQALQVMTDKLDCSEAYYANQLYLAQFGNLGLMPRIPFVVPNER
jgi:hypothetical protein